MAARHQSSGDYAVLARRRDSSITIPARSIGRDRRAIKREAGAGERVGAPSRRYLWIDDDIQQLCGMRESAVAAETSSLSIL